MKTLREIWAWWCWLTAPMTLAEERAVRAELRAWARRMESEAA